MMINDDSSSIELLIVFVLIRVVVESYSLCIASTLGILWVIVTHYVGYLSCRYFNQKFWVIVTHDFLLYKCTIAMYFERGTKSEECHGEYRDYQSPSLTGVHTVFISWVLYNTTMDELNSFDIKCSNEWHSIAMSNVGEWPKLYHTFVGSPSLGFLQLRMLCVCCV